MKSKLTEENRQMFEKIFGEGNINEVNNQAVEMMKQNNKRQTFAMNFVEKFFNFVSLIMAKVVPICCLFSVISNTRIETENFIETLKTVLEINFKQCFWIIASAGIIWISVEVLRFISLLIINIVYTFEIRYRVKKVRVLQDQVRQNLKKQDSESKKEETTDPDANKSNLNRTKYSDEEIIKKAQEMAKAYEQKNLNNPHLY
jgi:hypothetical protein